MDSHNLEYKPTPDDQGISLSAVVDEIVGDGVRLYGIFIFAFLDKDGNERVSCVPIDNPGIGQLISSLRIVEHTILSSVRPEGY